MEVEVMSAQHRTFKDKALELLAAKRPFQICVEGERCRPRHVTHAEAAQVSAASVGRRDFIYAYPRGIFELWREREREILRGGYDQINPAWAARLIRPLRVATRWFLRGV